MRPCYRIIALTLAVVFSVACGPASTPTSLPPTVVPPTPNAVPLTPAALPVAPTDLPPTTVRPTPSVSVVAPTSPPPTVAPTAVPPTPTALPAASPSPHPTDGGTPMPASQPTTGETRIRVIIGDTVLTGRLWDNATARDLIAQLPLTLTFSDFNGLEKIAPLPRKLSTEGVPAGADPLPRDIGYYAPCGRSRLLLRRRRLLQRHREDRPVRRQRGRHLEPDRRLHREDRACELIVVIRCGSPSKFSYPVARHTVANTINDLGD